MRELTWGERVLAVIVFAIVTVTPVLISVQTRSFREPKELFLRGAFVLLIGFAVIECIRRRQVRWLIDRRSPLVVVVLAGVGWTAVSLLFSTNRYLSALAFLRVAGLATLFLVTLYLSRRLPPAIVFFALAPALVNGVLMILETTGVWNPFYSDVWLRDHFFISGRDLSIARYIFNIALIGNPNYVGSYLAIAAIGAAAAAARYRAWAIPILLPLIAGAILSRALTGILALACGFAVLAYLINRKSTVIAFVIAPLLAVGIGLVNAPMRERIGRLADGIRAGDYDVVLSNRPSAFAAALQMARAHPLTGVGPGCYEFEYMPNRMELETRSPKFLGRGEIGVIFGETHNDHLQVLAETGLPGLLLFLAGFALLGLQSFRTPRATDDTRRRAARLLALPLAATVFVSALAHFPLVLPETSTLVAFLAALAVGWSDHATD